MPVYRLQPKQPQESEEEYEARRKKHFQKVATAEHTLVNIRSAIDKIVSHTEK